MNAFLCITGLLTLDFRHIQHGMAVHGTHGMAVHGTVVKLSESYPC